MLKKFSTPGIYSNEKREDIYHFNFVFQRYNQNCGTNKFVIKN
jgi:hypothetical protein